MVFAGRCRPNVPAAHFSKTNIRYARNRSKRSAGERSEAAHGARFKVNPPLAVSTTASPSASVPDLENVQEPE